VPPPDPADKLFNVDGEKFLEWFDDPKGNFVIDDLPPYIKEALGTQADSLIFSTDTLTKQKEHHPKISPEEYVRVLNKIGNRDVEMYQTKDRHVDVVIVDGQYWAAIIKTTEYRHENYLVSLYRLNEQSIVQFRKRKRIR
jgi:hypothetical protein